jgi:hypothetical protein
LSGRRIILREGDPRDIWIVPRVRGRFYMICCDCGLAHGYKFKVIKTGKYKGRIALLCTQAKRKTAAERRTRKHRCTEH